MITNDIQIQRINIEDLKPAEYNPRQASELEYDNLKKSLLNYGIVDPIIVNSAPNRKNVVIGGHFRLRVAKDIGYKNMPCVYVNVPDEKKEKELNLRLNKNLGEWDMDLLANLDEDLLKDVGFTSEELDKIFQLDVEPDADNVPEVRETNIKLGDMFQLGDHRLLCGDATQRTDVERLMNGQKADMVFTDPPYGVNFKYNQYDDTGGKEKHKEFCRQWFNILRYFTDFAVVTGGYGNQQIFFEIEPSLNTMVWYKKFGISRGFVAYATLTEPIYVYGKCPKGRYDTDFFEFQTDRTKGLHDKHPCPKPIKLLEALISPQIDRNRICMDLFGGSGSTMIACERLNRKCYMMEIDPLYCQTIIDRWEQYTNQKSNKINI